MALTATPLPSAASEGSDQPVVPPDKACVLVKNYTGSEVTFNLGPQTQKIPPDGQAWFIIEPGHMTWTANTPDGFEGGDEIDIQPGCEPLVLDVYLPH